MGNKSSTNKGSKDIKTKSTQRSKSVTLDNPLFDLLPNTAQAYRIKENPIQEQNSRVIKCPICENKMFYEALENYTICELCRTKFKLTSGNIKIAASGHRDIVDLNMNNYKFSPNVDMNNIPEIKRVVLSVCEETVPPEMKFAGSIDFAKIMNEIILPFFTSETRILKENNMFTIGGTCFKVLLCKPGCGKVTTETQIFCYREIRIKRNLCKVKIAPCTEQSFTVDDIFSYIEARKYFLHLERDQTFEVKGIPFKVMKCEPRSGILTQNTVILYLLIQQEEIHVRAIPCPPVKQIKIIGSLEKFPILVRRESFDREALEALIKEKLITPYYRDIARYCERGLVFNIGDEEFYIDQCDPPQGFTNFQTQISLKICDSIEDYKRKTVRQDGILQEDERVSRFIINGRPVSLNELEEEKANDGRRVPLRENNDIVNRRHHASPIKPKQYDLIRRIQDENNPPRHRTGSVVLTNDPVIMGPRASLNPGMQVAQPGRLPSRSNTMGGQRRALPKQKIQGATRQEISLLPLREIDIDFLLKNQIGSHDHVRCNICITEYEDKDKVRTLPCLHYFHRECIDEWLGRCKQCPICKTTIF